MADLDRQPGLPQPGAQMQGAARVGRDDQVRGQRREARELVGEQGRGQPRLLEQIGAGGAATGLVARKLLDAQPLFRRVVFLESRGRKLLDARDPALQPRLGEERDATKDFEAVPDEEQALPAGGAEDLAG